MNKETKYIIKKSVLSGFLYAGLMAVYENLTGEEFRIWYSIFNFLFMGTVLGILTRYEQKKNKEQLNQNSNT